MNSNDIQVAATAAWLAQYPENPTAIPSPTKTKVLQPFSSFVTRAWLYASGVWAFWEIRAVGTQALRGVRSIGWSRGLFIGIAVAATAVFGFGISSSVFRSLENTSLSWTQQRHCYQILRSASVIKRFLLLFPVEEAAHEAILNEIGWTESRQLLPSLSSDIHSVRSNLSGLVKGGQNVSQYLAYPCSDCDSTNLNIIGKVTTC